MNTYEKFTEAEVNELTNHGYEESMTFLFTGLLNDVLDNAQYIVASDLRNKLATVFSNDKLRSLLISSIEICEMAEFKMDSYSEFDLIIVNLLKLHEQLK